MSATEVCHIMEKSIKKRFPACETKMVPVADGGEGTVDCFLEALPGKKITLPVDGPFLEEIESFYGIVGDTAIIEMAAAAGFTLVGKNKNPSTTSTYGVGELVLDAIEKGCKQIVLGLGGSATNDGGTGIATALGTRFFNEEGEAFLPTGNTLSHVAHIDNKPTLDLLQGIRVKAMCDIDNPFYGLNGAAYVFAPQKGANTSMVKLLDENLRIFAEVIETSLGIQVQDLKGGGAAGGMGAGAYAFLGAELQQGIDVVLDLISFESMLEDCDCIFTGEGKLDTQSLGGKVVVGIGKRAKAQNIPVVAVVSYMEEELEELYDLGITKVVSVIEYPEPIEQLRMTCRQDLEETMDEILQEMA